MGLIRLKKQFSQVIDIYVSVYCLLFADFVDINCQTLRFNPYESGCRKCTKELIDNSLKLSLSQLVERDFKSEI